MLNAECRMPKVISDPGFGIHFGIRRSAFVIDRVLRLPECST